MISRKQIADAYNCCVDLVRPRLREVGIKHMRGLTLEEFRSYVLRWGMPINEKYQRLAKMALDSPVMFDKEM